MSRNNNARKNGIFRDILNHTRQKCFSDGSREGMKTLNNFIVSYKPTTSTIFTATAIRSSFDNDYDTCSFLDSFMDDRLHFT